MPHTVDVLIERRGESLAELAKSAGVSPERMEAIASGRWTPSPDERLRVAAALGVAVEAVSWGHTVNSRNVRYRQRGFHEPLSGGE